MQATEDFCYHTIILPEFFIVTAEKAYVGVTDKWEML